MKKTEIIAVASGKGGTGKTLILASLGYALVHAGHSVLLIDADPATDGLSLFLLGPSGKSQIENIPPISTFTGVLDQYRLSHEVTFSPHVIRRLGNEDHGISYNALISGRALYGSSSTEVRTEAVPDLDRETFRASIKALFAEIKNSGEFDYVLVDTRGGFAFESTEVCAAADSFFIVTEPDYTSFFQDRTLKERISDAAKEIQQQPLLKGIIVNKSHRGDEKEFRLELQKEFNVRFEDTYAVALDIDAIKAYQVQQIPYRKTPSARFCYDTLTAFSGLLNFVVAQWDKDNATAWAQLVDNVQQAIKAENAEVERRQSEAERREKEYERLETENRSLAKELELTKVSQTEAGKRSDELVLQLKTQLAEQATQFEREKTVERDHSAERIKALERELELKERRGVEEATQIQRRSSTELELYVERTKLSAARKTYVLAAVCTFLGFLLVVISILFYSVKRENTALDSRVSELRERILSTEEMRLQQRRQELDTKEQSPSPEKQ